MTTRLEALAAARGIAWRYRDGAGHLREASPESLRAALAALGVAALTEAEARDSLAAHEAAARARTLPAWIVAEAGRTAELRPGHERPVAWRLVHEDGGVTEGRAKGRIAIAPLPPGYHRLEVGGEATAILAVPASLPPVPRGWGVIAPLYGLRPAATGGLGDYADLAELARVLGGKGAAFLGINPVHAGFPCDPAAISPYSPSSREWLATMHIADGNLARPGGRLVGYPDAIGARMARLEVAYRDFLARPDAAFDAWRCDQGDALQAFAAHQALSEAHGPYWCDWPAAFRSPDTPGTAGFAARARDRVGFHAWLQWRAETQLAEAQRAARDAGMAHGLYLDLAVGTHPHGAETWADPGLFAPGVSLGAPPDAFAPLGQTWNLAPMRPDVLAARGFAPFARILRRQIRHAGILRIDHILGFERAFWVPEGLPGLYVAMPRDALLAVARIEAARAGAVIVGEDLGAIPEGLREALAASGILGCRVAMFERDWQGDRHFLAPETYARQSIASFGSHDLPLWKGWRRGGDIAWRARLGAVPAAAAPALRAERKADIRDFDAACGARRGSFAAMTGFVARTGSALAAVQIEDLLGQTGQPNLPGTVDEHPNWRRRLRLDVSGIAADPTLERTARIMARNGR